MAQLVPASDLHHQNNTNDIASVDDFYFSALFDEPPAEIFPISDSKYAEELQFQEALMSSTKTDPPQTTTETTETTTCNVASSSSSSLLLSSSLSPQALVQVLVPFLVDDGEECSAEELGESSHMFCEICAEKKSAGERFAGGSECRHSFCSACMARHVATKLDEGSVSEDAIPCPGPACKGVHEIGIEPCRGVLPRDVVERWDEALCEALVMALPRLYCPFKDCSAVMVREEEEEEEEGEAAGAVVEQSECPECHRLFCARCGVGPWHAGVGCEEFERLRVDEQAREDLMVKELAKEKKWMRCPNCLFYVERNEGCLHITCRCAFEFCYACGDAWTQTHGGCQGD